MSWTDVDGTVEIGSGSLTGDRTGGAELPLVGGVGGELLLILMCLNIGHCVIIIVIVSYLWKGRLG